MAAEEWGVLTSQELADCGLGPNAVRRRLNAGHLHRLYRGVYAVGHTNLTLEGRFLAAVKACVPGAALSHLARRSTEFSDPFDRLIDITVTGTSPYASRNPRAPHSRPRCP